MKNVLDFIKFALSHAHPASVPKGTELPYPVGDAGVWEYLWGTRGQVCTEKLLDARFDSYYSKHGWERGEFDTLTKGWVEKGVHVTDCQGLLDAYLGNDTNANGDYNSYCTDKGPCDKISRPYVIGEAVFMGTAVKKTHVGWVCGFDKNGNPLVVENRGLKYGVVVTKLHGRGWDYRGLMTKKFSYAEAPAEDVPADVFIFYRNLKRGMKGEDVVELKKLLIDKGYHDGITINTKSSPTFGPATKKLVKQFQADNGLTVDGVAGKQTITTLGGYYQ